MVCTPGRSVCLGLGVQGHCSRWHLLELRSLSHYFLFLPGSGFISTSVERVTFALG